MVGRATDREKSSPRLPILRSTKMDLPPPGRRRQRRGPGSASTRIMPALLPGNVQIWLPLIGAHNRLWHGPGARPQRDHMRACMLAPAVPLRPIAASCVYGVHVCGMFSESRRRFTPRLGLKRAYS